MPSLQRHRRWWRLLLLDAVWHCSANPEAGSTNGTLPEPDRAGVDLAAASEPFDCQVDPAEHWSEAKKQWCCSEKQLGCAKQDKDGVAESEPFDCQVDPVEHWSEAKQQWCCSHKQLGCAKQDAPLKDGVAESEPFDCQVDPVEHWSEAKQQWCCSHKQLGCAKQDAPLKDGVATSEPFDCQVDPVEHWSEAKQQWCCSHKLLGCFKQGAALKDGVAESEPFDCKVDPVEHWSEAKQQWCCSHKQLGCAEVDRTAGSEPFDCKVDPVEHWSDAKKQWCCSQKELGCDQKDGPDESEPFDCQVDPAEHWSQKKRQWCCSHKQLGCGSKEPEHELFSCVMDADHGDPPEQWSDMKKEWCCEEKQVGCPTFSPSEYDCRTGLSEWRQKWTEMQALWCCVFKGVACADDEAETPLQRMKEAQTQEDEEEEKELEEEGETAFEPEDEFDCAEGLANWERGFSDEKKDFCCRRHHVACPRDQQSSFVCTVGSPDHWTVQKTIWCCQRLRLDHPACAAVTAPLAATPYEDPEPEKPAFNCFAGAGDRRTWSRQKQAWCCTFRNVACQALRTRSEDYPSAAKHYALQGQQSERFSASQDPERASPTPHPSEDEGGSVWLFSLIMVLAVIVTYQRLKGGFCADNSRRSYSYGPTGTTTYGRSGNGVYSAVSTRYTPPALPLG